MAEKMNYLDDQDVKDFTKDIRQYNLGPLWEAIPALMHKQPEPHAKAYLMEMGAFGEEVNGSGSNFHA